MPHKITKLSKDTTMNVNITYAVTLTRQLKFRVWLATRLMILAAKILGCGIEIRN